MKPKIKFGVFDIILCIVVVALFGVNIYAYASDKAPVKTGEPSGRTESPPPDSDEPVRLEPDALTAVVVAGEWRMNLFFCNDENYETWYALYELDISMSAVTRDVYSICVRTAGAEYADGTKDGLEAIAGTVSGTAEDGMLCFALPGLEATPLYMTYFYMEDEIVAIAYESDSAQQTYLAAEMFRPV